MTREEVILEAVSRTVGQAAGIGAISVQVNRIMRREGERALSAQTIRDALGAVTAQHKLQVTDIEGMTAWCLTKKGKQAMRK